MHRTRRREREGARIIRCCEGWGHVSVTGVLYHSSVSLVLSRQQLHLFLPSTDSRRIRGQGQGQVCQVEMEPAPWVHPHLSVAGLWEAPAVTTPEMQVEANSSTHPESKQTVTEVKPREVTQESTEAVPIHSGQWSLGLGQIIKGLFSLAKGQEQWTQGWHMWLESSMGSASLVPEGLWLSLTPFLHLGRYSAVRPLLADLEQETRAALKTLYGFSEIESRKRREAEPWSAAWEGPQPKFLHLIPLMVFNEGETSKATDFLTGQKRKVSGSIIHKAADVMHVQESKEVVGFQLVSMHSGFGVWGGLQGGVQGVVSFAFSPRSHWRKRTQGG